MTEKQIERKLKKIKSLKSILKKEKVKFGCYDDSSGRRYSIAELYFEINDFRKTNLYLNWFNKNFSDDVTYPYFQLNSAQTYYKVNKTSAAIKSIVKLNCLNMYLLDLLNNKAVQKLDIIEWTESESLNWAEDNYENYKRNLTTEFLEWLDKELNSAGYQQMKHKYISILNLLQYTEDSIQRKELFKAKRTCEENWQRINSNTTHNK